MFILAFLVIPLSLVAVSACSHLGELMTWCLFVVSYLRCCSYVAVALFLLVSVVIIELSSMYV